MLQFSNLFYEIAAILSLAITAGALAIWLRQPIIIAFIVVGVIVGPSGLALVASSDEVSLFAKLGITLLLFVVGLKLDPNEIKAVGPVAVVLGLGQILITALFGYAIAFAMGLNALSAFYVATALTFSSTIIIIKLLSDQREIDALHGRIAVGVLIVQDIAVVLVMIGLSAWGGQQSSGTLPQLLAWVTLKGIGFLGSIALVTRFLLPRLLHSLARSPEILVLTGITWAIALAATADGLGFSKEVGAFLAGVAIAATPYRVPIASRLVSLRDFLLLFFFIDLGSNINLDYLGQQILPALILSAFVLLGKPVMVMGLMGLMGYRKYTSALTSLSLCQISEFSLILAALGMRLGHIDQSTLGLITLVGLITMGLSSYLILNAHRLYPRISRGLDMFERNLSHTSKLTHSEATEDWTPVDFIVFGLGRYGGSVVRDLCQAGFMVLGVDFDPEIVTAWNQEGLRTLYGDADDPELAALLPLQNTRWVISTVPKFDVGLTLLHTLKHHQFSGKVALTSHHAWEAELLLQAGADQVLLPFRDAAKEAARMLTQSGDPR
ncbi:cation:proton antiporter [Lyngbya confervoides]|uniref:Cation:proton antiporter n=1 Tax=Lyngbya confervoides BDU141951 TaxID=1574623 RepID=A0ABD4T5X9_9CYAN|nr:cation:proton antiporter family protein [Lyngbya confervoides]MCM1984108.1 cation:proton antiporter [Lyngbya confervoides BDU141951]